MAKNKTTETTEKVSEFLKTLKDQKKWEDCATLVAAIEKHTKLPPKMWGSAIMGFGTYSYKYESGREGNAPLIGLSPRAAAISLYLSGVKNETELLKQFGKYKLGGGCIYIKKLEDIDTKIMMKLVDHSIKFLKNLYPG
ncbi:MAG: DUF1801 domain-containing protein [bacterium]|nr:DUF1801 domain-containing protein [bacterium]